MPLEAAPPPAESVEDVEWSDSDDDSRSGAEVPDVAGISDDDSKKGSEHDKSFEAHSHSNIDEEDAKAPAKDDISDVSDAASVDAKSEGPAAADEPTEEKEKDDESSSSLLSDSDEDGADGGREAPESEVSQAHLDEDTLAGAAAGEPAPGAGVGDLEDVEPEKQDDDDKPAKKTKSALINEDANEETEIIVDAPDGEGEDEEEPDHPAEPPDEEKEEEEEEMKPSARSLTLSARVAAGVKNFGPAVALRKRIQTVRERHPAKWRCGKCTLLICILPLLVIVLLLQILKCCCGRLLFFCHCRREEVEEEVEEEVAEWTGPERSRLKPPDQFTRHFKDSQRYGYHHKDSQGESPKGEDHHHHALRAEAAGKPRKSHAGVYAPRRVKAKGAASLFVQGDLDLKVEDKGNDKDPWWYNYKELLHPNTLPGLLRRKYHERVQYHKRIGSLLDTIQKEEEEDWNNIDEHGNPAKVPFLVPRFIRRRLRFFMLVYWEPLMDLLEKIPLALNCLKWVIRLAPVIAFLTSVGWFSYSFYRNLQYEDGTCTVQLLPTSFATTGVMTQEVEAEYIVRRTYIAKLGRAKGSYVKPCKTTVDCDTMDYRLDKCVAYRTWKIGDRIKCYFHKDDYWGDKGEEIFCLDLPSKLERELFTLAVTGTLLTLTTTIAGILRWRSRDLARQAELAQKDAEKQAEEMAAAKKAIEEKEAQEAKKRREKELNEGINEEEGHDFEAQNFGPMDTLKTTE